MILMFVETYLHALLLGLVEGLTEFIPVSSTGHLILLVDFLGFRGPPGKVFEVVIQLGAILAVCVVYAHRLLRVVLGLWSQPRARAFALAVVLAFLPAALVGVIAHSYIKAVLFSPQVVATSLLVGGVVIILVERFLPAPRYHRIESFSLPMSLGIGLFQCLAMVPGVSRSGATIIGAMLLGVERRVAAEFSFFVAIPTMLGAATYDLYKNWGGLTLDGGLLIGAGFLMAFVAAVLVVQALITFITRYGFQPFGWYRIVLGVGMLLWLNL